VAAKDGAEDGVEVEVVMSRHVYPAVVVNVVVLYPIRMVKVMIWLQHLLHRHHKI
jgi:hypothetical protein